MHGSCKIKQACKASPLTCLLSLSKSSIWKDERRTAHQVFLIHRSKAVTIEVPDRDEGRIPSYVWVVGLDAKGQMNYDKYDYKGATALVDAFLQSLRR